MSLQRAKEMREEAGRAHKLARDIQEKCGVEKRDMTEEELTQFNAHLDEAEGKVKGASALERSALMGAGEGAELRERILSLSEQEKTEGTENRSVTRRGTPEYRKAFAQVIRGGAQNVGAEQRAALQLDNDLTGGVFSPPDQMLAGLLKNVDDAVLVRQFATGHVVPFGASLGIVRLTGDVGVFEWGGGELTAAVEDTGLEFGKREFKPRELKDKLIKVSERLLANGTTNVEEIINKRVAILLDQTLEQAYMTGDGAAKPLGMFVANDEGIPTSRDVNTGSATGLTGDGLMDVQGTLKPQYQAAARWLHHRNWTLKIRKLKDGDGRYIWQPGLALGEVNTILGKPYIESEFAPHTYTNGLYAGLYGDLSYYWYCDSVDQIRVKRLVELYSLTNQIGLQFKGLAADGQPVLAEAFVRAKCAA